MKPREWAIQKNGMVINGTNTVVLAITIEGSENIVGAETIRAIEKSAYDSVCAQLAEEKTGPLVSARNALSAASLLYERIKHLEEALAYAKQTWDEHPAKSVWDAAVERLERGE